MNEHLPVIIEPHSAEPGKKRIAAYCRVSSLSEEQVHSYHAQVDYYRNLFGNDDSVIFVGVYGDAGISGTRAANREGFMRMMEDCRRGEIDCIWTKSVSRFGRNTVDTLIYTRELRSLGIDVYFEKENTHTLEPTGEMLLTLMAAFAESESAAMSDNIKWGKRRRFEGGHVETITIHNLTGYKQANGVVTIVESEAAVVRRIYQEYLDGYNMNEIARRLNADAVPTKTESAEWTGTQIRNILMNEKYCGDCILQKTYVTDPILHHHARNRGELARYYVAACYPVIIEKELWLIVQEMIKRYGSKLMTSQEDYPFKRKLYCSICGDAYVQHQSFGTGRVRIFTYRCGKYRTDGGVEVPGMTYTPPHKATYTKNPTPELVVYREKYSKKSVPRTLRCTDIRIEIDQPAKAFVLAWNLMISHKYRYLPLLERKADDEDILVRYFSSVLRQLIEDGERLDEFDPRLFRKTVEKIDVQPTGKLAFQFKAGITITV